MKKNRLFEELSKAALLVHNLAGLDVMVADASGQVLVSLSAVAFPEAYRGRSGHMMGTARSLLMDGAPQDYCHLAGMDRLEFLAAGIWREEVYVGTVAAGPFLAARPEETVVDSLLDALGLGVAGRMTVQQFYKALPVVDSQRYMQVGSLLVNLFSRPFLDGRILAGSGLVAPFPEPEMAREGSSFSTIELRYRTEKRLLRAIETGDKDEALRVLGSYQFNAHHRVPRNPLRAEKNLAFVLNTECRLAVERAKVPAPFIHEISDRFAILIEKAGSLSELRRLQIAIVSEYSILARTHTLKGYSRRIRKAVDFIDTHYREVLDLKTVAAVVPMNPSHLSTRFKEETGMNLTAYINAKRVDEAKFLLDQGLLPIGEAALAVGFGTVNNFNIVFRKMVGMTPSEYAERKDS